MKKTAIPVLILVFFSVSNLFSAAKIKLESERIHFGEIKAGKVVDFHIKFKNTGDSILKIRNVRTDSSITVAVLKKKEFDPGEEGIIYVKFNSAGLMGRIGKSIHITTNDKENIICRVRVIGKVVQSRYAFLEFVGSDSVELGMVKKGGNPSRTLQIKNSGSIDLMINEVTHSPDIIPFFEKKVIAPGTGSNIKIVFKPLIKGPFERFLKIYSNSFRSRLVVVKISGDVR